jgi:hypothetical protein
VRGNALTALMLASALAGAQAPAPQAAPAPAAEALDLGTLFHSAEERARLDKLRRGEPPEPAAARRAPPAVTGFVQRSDGRNTVWVDGRPVPVASPRAAPLFDPRVVRDMPPPPEPPAPKADAESPKNADAPKKDADAPKNADAAKKAEGEASPPVKR